jgi:hypothetical protein
MSRFARPQRRLSGVSGPYRPYAADRKNFLPRPVLHSRRRPIHARKTAANRAWVADEGVSFSDGPLNEIAMGVTLGLPFTRPSH